MSDDLVSPLKVLIVIFYLRAVLAILALGMATISSSSYGITLEGAIAKLENAQLWISKKDCTQNECYWRATTLCLDNDYTFLTVVKFKKEQPFLALSFNNPPASVRAEWGNKPMRFKVKLRVDKKTTYPVMSTMYFDSMPPQMFCNLHFRQDTDGILNDLMTGQTVRLRLYGESSNQTLSFSLHNCSEHIKRVLTGFDEKSFQQNPDPYFNDRE